VNKKSDKIIDTFDKSRIRFFQTDEEKYQFERKNEHLDHFNHNFPKLDYQEFYQDGFPTDMSKQNKSFLVLVLHQDD